MTLTIGQLGEVLTETIGAAKLLIEIKEEGFEDELIEVIKMFKAEEDVIVTSFIESSLAKIKNHGLVETSLNTKDFASGIETAKSIGASYIQPFKDQITEELVAKAQSAGLFVFAGSCDTEEDIIRIREMGVDAISSNNPGLLANVIKGK